MFWSMYKLWSPGIYGEWIVAFTACLCIMACGQSFTWTAAALPRILDGSAGFTLTEDEESWMVTILFVGNIITPFIAGYFMDWFGRKNSLMFFDALVLASWVLTYYGQSAGILYVIRVIQGSWVGFSYTVVPILIAEVVRPEIRDSIGGVYGMMLSLGGVIESLLGTYISYKDLALYSMITPVLVFVIFLLVPEPPYYHLMKGDRQKAIASIVWLRGKCDMEALDKMEESVQEQLNNKGTFLDMVRVKHYRKALIIVEALAIFQRLSGVSLLISLGTLIIPDSFLTKEQSYTAMNAAWFIGSFSSYFFLDKYPRRGILAVSCYGCGMSIFATSLWFLFRDFTQIDTTTTQWLPIIFVFCYCLSFAWGLISIPHMIHGEIFSVDVKGKGSALATATGALGSSIALRLFYPIKDFGGIFANLLVASFFCIVCGTIALTYMVETKGKSLERIQEELTGKRRTKIILNNHHKQSFVDI